MKIKFVLIIALLALLIPCPCSSELVKLPRYTIDTGSFVIPFNYKIQEPETVNGIYYEGLTWDIGINRRSMIIIAECNESIDPRSIQYALMANALCGDSSNLVNRNAYTPVEKPYPGWISSCKAKGNRTQISVYTGSVNKQTILAFSTSEDPDDAASILEGIRVISPEKVTDTL